MQIYSPSYIGDIYRHTVLFTYVCSSSYGTLFAVSKNCVCITKMAGSGLFTHIYCTIQCIWYHLILLNSLLNGIVAIYNPQRYSIMKIQMTKPLEYVCDSYIRQFYNIKQVSFETMRQMSDSCHCHLELHRFEILDRDNDDTVLWIKFQTSDDAKLVRFGWFKDCQGNLSFSVTSYVQQTNLHVFCGDYYYVNDISRLEPIVLTVSSAFSESLSLQCQSENDITTSSTSVSNDSEPTEGPITPPAVQSENKQEKESQGSSEEYGNSTEFVAPMVIWLLLLLLCVATAAMLALFQIRAKKAKEQKHLGQKEVETISRTVVS